MQMPNLQKNFIPSLIQVMALCVALFSAVSAEAFPCCGPVASFSVAQSDQYGWVVNPRYANFLTPTSALGLEIGFSSQEFRIGGTWVKSFADRHLLKLSADYLSLENEYDYLTGSRFLWNIQHTLGAGYSYFFDCPRLVSLNVGGYQTYSRDDNLPDAIIDEIDNVWILKRRISGGEGYGGKLGFTLQPWETAGFDIDIYYDTFSYRHEIVGGTPHNGIGIGLRFTQALSQMLRMELSLAQRAIFDQYQGSISWCLPTRRSNWELALIGQYVNGDLPTPTERRIGLMMTYHWVPGHFIPSSSPPCIVDLLASALRPVERMPQTFNRSYQQIAEEISNL